MLLTQDVLKPTERISISEHFYCLNPIPSAHNTSGRLVRAHNRYLVPAPPLNYVPSGAILAECDFQLTQLVLSMACPLTLDFTT
jgi:hypothetical protein